MTQPKAEEKKRQNKDKQHEKSPYQPQLQKLLQMRNNAFAIKQKLVLFEVMKIMNNTKCLCVTCLSDTCTCAANISLAIALVPQLFFNDCADASEASISAILSASAIQLRLRIIVFPQLMIKV